MLGGWGDHIYLVSKWDEEYGKYQHGFKKTE